MQNFKDNNSVDTQPLNKTDNVASLENSNDITIKTSKTDTVTKKKRRGNKELRFRASKELEDLIKKKQELYRCRNLSELVRIALVSLGDDSFKPVSRNKISQQQIKLRQIFAGVANNYNQSVKQFNYLMKLDDPKILEKALVFANSNLKLYEIIKLSYKTLRQEKDDIRD